MKRLLSLFATVALLEAQSLQAQRIQTIGPYGGDVGCSAVNGSILFWGTFGGGVFLSTNNVTSWNAVNAGVMNTHVRSLAVNGANLFAGANDGGVWRRSLSEMVTGGEDHFSQVPVGFTPEQNSPNPLWRGSRSEREKSPQPPFATIYRKQPRSCSRSTILLAGKCARWSMRVSLPV